ncbi:MAG: hypothetical protein ACO24O_08790 [Arenimonas sp.]
MSQFNDQLDKDMQAYINTPPIAPSSNQEASGSAGAVFSSSPSPAESEPDFSDLGLDTNTQLLEAILAELRSVNQNIRELL